jgi:starch synthase
MQIVFIASEAAPFAKTGGLADVVGALPKALAALGHDVYLILPFYRSVRACDPKLVETRVAVSVDMPKGPLVGRVVRTDLPGSDVPVFLVQNDELYDREALYGASAGDYADNCQRFAFFSRAALLAIDELDLTPDVIHAHDWQTGLVPPLLTVRHAQDPAVARAARVFTVHNLSYQGLFWHWDMPLTGLPWEMFNWQELEFHNKINLLKGGIVFADLITTVSPRYAQEIQTPAFGCGLEEVLKARAADLVGVVNGVDYSVWSPDVDPFIPANYSADDLSGKAACKRQLQLAERLPAVDVPLVGMVTRLVDQKGLDLLIQVLDEVMALELQLVVLGAGMPAYEKLLTEYALRFPHRLSVHIGFDNELAHRIEAGADLFLMPSQFEPCGLNQLYSLRYGTVPLVHETGGLADTVVNLTGETLAAGRANGFSFAPYLPDALMECLKAALNLYAKSPDIWRRLQVAAMRQDFSWDASARRYVELYALARERAAKRPKRGAGR